MAIGFAIEHLQGFQTSEFLIDWKNDADMPHGSGPGGATGRLALGIGRGHDRAASAE